MNEFEFRITELNEKLQEFVQAARDEAKQLYEVDRQNWEQKIREYEGALKELEYESQKWQEEAEAAERRYLNLQAKITALV